MYGLLGEPETEELFNEYVSFLVGEKSARPVPEMLIHSNVYGDTAVEATQFDGGTIIFASMFSGEMCYKMMLGNCVHHKMFGIHERLLKEGNEYM